MINRASWLVVFSPRSSWRHPDSGGWRECMSYSDMPVWPGHGQYGDGQILGAGFRQARQEVRHFQGERSVGSYLLGHYKMDRTFYSLFVVICHSCFAAIASPESRPESEATVECAIHFVMAQQIRTDAAVTFSPLDRRSESCVFFVGRWMQLSSLPNWKTCNCDYSAL